MANLAVVPGVVGRRKVPLALPRNPDTHRGWRIAVGHDARMASPGADFAEVSIHECRRCRRAGRRLLPSPSRGGSDPPAAVETVGLLSSGTPQGVLSMTDLRSATHRAGPTRRVPGHQRRMPRGVRLVIDPLEERVVLSGPESIPVPALPSIVSVLP